MNDTIDAQRLKSKIDELDDSARILFLEALSWVLDPTKRGQFIFHKARDGRLVQREIRDFKNIAD